jgi:small conductance mechanosensitive channel
MLDTLVEHLDPKIVSAKITSYLPHILAALVLLLVFWIMAMLVRRALSAALRHSGISQGPSLMLVNAARFIVFAIGAMTIADQLGVNVTSMVAGLGVAGLAISFAAQDTVANFISGITLAIDRPFRVGDWVAIGELHATVSELRLRTTVLTTFDNETLVLPNKVLTQERIINYTLTPRVRMRVSVRIAYKESVAAARQTLLATLEGDTRVLLQPAPLVIVTELGDSSVNLQLRFWTEDPLLKFPLQWEYMEKCKKALDDAGIQIPFPHLQLFVEDHAGVRLLAGRKA